MLLPLHLNLGGGGGTTLQLSGTLTSSAGVPTSTLTMRAALTATATSSAGVISAGLTATDSNPKQDGMMTVHVG
jgi:hypothetical protein